MKITILFLRVIFALLDPDPRELKLMRIRVRNPDQRFCRQLEFLEGHIDGMVPYQSIKFHAPPILVPIPAFELGHDETNRHGTEV
jgi:hypothetical protein